MLPGVKSLEGKVFENLGDQKVFLFFTYVEDLH